MNMHRQIGSPGKDSDHDRDFHAWLDAQAAILRRRDAEALDWERLAEEIEDMGGNLRRELKSRMAVIIFHLLKLRLSSATEPRAGWIETVATQRGEIERLLDDNPSLKRFGPDFADALFGKERERALEVLAAFEPEGAAAHRAACETIAPFTFEEITGSAPE